MAKMTAQKEFADELRMHERTFRRWCRTLKMEPTLPAQSHNLWDEETKAEWVRRYKRFNERKKSLVHDDYKTVAA